MEIPVEGEPDPKRSRRRQQRAKRTLWTAITITLDIILLNSLSGGAAGSLASSELELADEKTLNQLIQLGAPPPLFLPYGKFLGLVRDASSALLIRVFSSFYVQVVPPI